MTAIGSASSGMMAAAARLSASASNIANVGSAGSIPGGSATRPQPVYRPVHVAQVSLSSGAVDAQVQPEADGYQTAYDPTAPYADAQGMVATPNVDLASEVVDQVGALAAFKANVASFEAADAMMKALLDLKA